MGHLARLQPPTGLRAVVTAGAGGIGLAITEALVEAGARVVICDVDQGALDAVAARHPAAVTPVLADVGDPAQVNTLFDRAEAVLGGLDLLVNNAGIAGPTGPVETLAIEDWRRTIDIDLNGQFYCARRAVPLLRASDHAALITISSVAGRLGYPLRTPYAAAKWGIVGLTESLARELGPDGIRVNAILPGVVRGPRIERVIAARAESRGIPYGQMEDEYLTHVSLRQMVEADDIASMVLFLMSPGGRSIAGQALSVCGNVETVR